MNLPAPVVLEHSSFFDAFFASSIAVSLLTLFLLFLLKGKHTFLRFGITSLRLLAILIIVRGFLPVELLAPTFPITQTIFSRKILPALRDLLLHPLWTAGASVLTPMILLVALWLSVSFYCLFRKIRGYLQFQNSLLSLPEISDPETLEILQTVLDSLFPNKNIKTRLVQSHGFISPAIWGLCRPTIILPCILADNSKELSYGIPPGYTGEELSCIFSHELLHYKHRDFHLKFLLDLLLSFHWWNPLLTHCLSPAVTQAQELSVDEYLTRTMSRAEKTQYLEALSKTLHFQKSRISAGTEQTYAFADQHHKKAVLQRLRCIIDAPAKRPSGWSTALCIVLFLLSFSFIFDTYYDHSVDEYGYPVFKDIKGQTFYVRNGEMFDLYLENQYFGTFPKILESFKDAPVYDNISEAHIP